MRLRSSVIFDYVITSRKGVNIVGEGSGKRESGDYLRKHKLKE